MSAPAALAGSADVEPPPLTLFTGTKAQFIKMVPVALEFETRGWDYSIIDTGQHAELVRHIISQFGLRSPDHSLAPKQTGVATLLGGLRWLVSVSRHLLRRRDSLRREFFDGQSGLCFVHGDTVSTLVSTLLAKRAGQRVAHVEAGLRSHRLLHPFPEELVRVVVMRLADVLFAPSASAHRNLVAMGLGARAHLLPGNTNIDTLALALASPCGELPELPTAYGIATIHRLETLYSRRRLAQVIDFVLLANDALPVLFVLHPPTERRLAESGLQDRLAAAGVRSLPLLDHRRFVHLLGNARFVMTDGGSVQEEAYYLGIPTLILREATERDEGVGQNAVLSRLDPPTVERFVANFDAHRRPRRVDGGESPSRAIADWVADLGGGLW